MAYIWKMKYLLEEAMLSANFTNKLIKTVGVLLLVDKFNEK